jgi:hypothetical protein
MYRENPGSGLKETFSDAVRGRKLSSALVCKGEVAFDFADRDH